MRSISRRRRPVLGGLTRYCLLTSVLVAGWGSASCSSSNDAAPVAADGGAVDGGPTGEGGAGQDGAVVATPCPRSPKAADRVRSVVISHPFDASGGKANGFEVLRLATDGTLSRSGTKFEMGNNFDSPIVFTPDGEIGVSVHDKDGTLGFFRIDDAGAVTVIDPSFGAGQFYADAAVFSADGSRLFVIDGNKNTTGGVHEVSVGCDGKPTYKGRIQVAAVPSTIGFVPGTSRVAVTALSADGVPAGRDLFFLDLSGAGAVTDSLALFGDDQVSAHGIAFTPDGKLGFVADGNDVLGTKRVGTFSLDPAPAKLKEFEVEGPTGVVVSPFGNAALVTAAGGGSIDALYTFSIAGAGAAATVTAKGKMTSLVGAKPQLPTCPNLVSVGSLKGLVLIGEVEGVRRARFEANGDVTDLGVFTIPGDVDMAVGCVGVQP